MSLSYMREYAIMKNVKFDAAVKSLSPACWDLFLQLHSIGKPLPEGMAVIGNGTGYYNRTTEMFKGIEVPRNTIYATVCPDTQRRILIVPVKAIYGLKRDLGEDKVEDSLVFFERYTPSTGSVEVLMEQLTGCNNAYVGTTLEMAKLLHSITDFM